MNVSWRSLMNLFYLHLVLLLQLFSQNSIQMVFTDHAYCGVIKTRSYTNFLLLIWVQYPVFICAHFHHQIAAKYYKRFSKLNLILILQGFMSASGVGIIVFMQKHRFSEVVICHVVLLVVTVMTLLIKNCSVFNYYLVPS